MRIFFFSTSMTIILDIILWFLIHMSVSYMCYKMPARSFTGDTGLYKARDWEDSGNFYQRVFKVKKWKYRLPDGGSFFSQGFSKKSLTQTSVKYLEQFIIETRRAELSHWLQMIPVPLFFLFNKWWVGIIMILYALAVNIPCIIALRYNRFRLIRLTSEKQGSHADSFIAMSSQN